jgi:hypothetical protein
MSLVGYEDSDSDKEPIKKEPIRKEETEEKTKTEKKKHSLPSLPEIFDEPLEKKVKM